MSTHPGPYGNYAHVASRNDPTYKRIAENHLAILRLRMTEHEFSAWQWRNFERAGETMQDYAWSEIMLAASMEINHPAECTCVDGSCIVCKSYTRVQQLVD
jgi:hypothetical protein